MSLSIPDTVSGLAWSNPRATSLRVSFLHTVVPSGINCRSEGTLKTDEMSERGFHPANTSNFESAIAISGLWLGSENLFGSWKCSSCASSVLGWICKGSALAMESIYEYNVSGSSLVVLDMQAYLRQEREPAVHVLDDIQSEKLGAVVVQGVF